MPKALRWKVLLMAALVAVSAVLVLPSFTSGLPDWFTRHVYNQRLKLGLDLQGGMHLILKVDVDQAVINATENKVRDLLDALKSRGITARRLRNAEPGHIVISLPNKRALETAKHLVQEEFDLEAQEVPTEGAFPRLRLTLAPKAEKFLRDHAVEQSLEIIRNRIDQFGVTEPVIVRQGQDEIVVQLPGVKDPKRALKLIGQTAQLKFKLVDEAAGVDLDRLISDAIADGRLPADYDVKTLNAALRGFIPEGDAVYLQKIVDRRTGRVRKVPILLKDRTLMTGDLVKDAYVRVDTYRGPYVAMEFTDQGARRFERITAENVKRRLAIVLDDVVRSAPVIQERIAGGHAQITGTFSYEEASDLAIVLRAGALPAPVKIIQNVTVGPSLGRDSVRRGLFSGLVGAALVVVFMVFYYRFSGLVADVAMALNILFLFAVLALFQATLTLPGIAGIILTVGMGVDSNVLIFERMREEKALGKPLKAFIDGGYDKAFWTIVDAHVTTLITALALFLFGTGPIKGFAVTLSAGILINLFTAIFGTRIVYDWMLAKRALKDLSFLQVIRKTRIDFIGRRRIAYVISGLLVALGLVAFVQIWRGAANLGVDFAGGTMIQYRAEKPFALADVRRALAATGLEGITLQDVQKEHVLIVRLKKAMATVGDTESRLTGALRKGLPDAGFVMESKTEIGSAVSRDLRHKALIAIAISLAGIIGYLAFRFNVSFGVAAAAATFHDVLAVLGIFYLTGREITLILVTALLTLAGYSLTDTVVIFDRIRENLRRHGRGAFAEIINLSVNEMLGRTIITSLTTLMVILCLVLFGGVVIFDFALALLLGVIVGTYSSVFVASPIVHAWHKGKAPRT
ncbi:protein translocase subunit SecD [Dissulfurirhabdus thermomarina]|uniref:Multifunctional fusion protein n=1 Tax=Dissulfurirhabdus thermomarina TaxID=1765737 RepID=A0A6N9TNF8_DISTH|nr:protein translocase subunit SecD [Dissulfurirhabdus thermomarina]NDY42578.1 protein translocase subunit SecD [Dissulfurirhabdus thermomarina]NMX22511.1 protein translocase subunit SecD [Dissulfurirhabdus thermomarina]